MDLKVCDRCGKQFQTTSSGAAIPLGDDSVHLDKKAALPPAGLQQLKEVLRGAGEERGRGRAEQVGDAATGQVELDGDAVPLAPAVVHLGIAAGS